MKKVFSALLALTLFVCMLIPVSAAEQNQITKQTPLLNSEGSLTEAGYCFTPLYQYKRDDVTAPSWRIKEWDFYQTSNEKYLVQVTISDISLGSTVSVFVLDFETGKSYSVSKINLFTFGNIDLGTQKGLCENDWVDHSYVRKTRNFDFELNTYKDYRTIKFTGKSGSKDFTIDLKMDLLENHESHFTALPFDGQADHFYYNQKTNCMATTGTVTIGDTVMEFKGKEDNSFTVLDWGRGVWPFHETWWWGNGSYCYTDDKQQEHIFGFEIGWDFCDTTAASESTAFLDGKAYKLGYLTLENQDEIVKPWDSDWSDNGIEWKITSDDGSFEMTFTPEYDNYTMARVICVGNLCHQVFGRWNGTVKCGDKTIEIKDMYAFLERSDNMW